MRWRGRRQSDNIEDKRSSTGGGFGFPMPGGRRMRIPVPQSRGAKRGGIGGIGIIILIGLMLFFGGDLGSILQRGNLQETTTPNIQIPDIMRNPGQTRQTTQRPARNETPATTGGDQLKSFVAVVLADTEDVWNEIFRSHNKQYVEPKLVLFRGTVRSGCGQGQAAMGPFYCPLDKKVYIDLSFFEEMKTRFKAPGDFAQAYVIAHEVGHHVQTLLGIADQVTQAKARASQKQANAIQVRMELQADCLAGVWANRAHKTKNILEAGDVEEALGAATAIGDDTIQKRSRGIVVPDAFTHGSSAQRVRWFRRGLESGNLRDCDTFNARTL